MKKIPMLDLYAEYQYMKKDIDAAIKRCLKHQQWILGPEVKELEGKIASYLKAEHCVGISSGTEALVIALRALALTRFNTEYFSKEQKIITTPLTFTATGDAILRSGATPVFIDIDPETCNIDPEKVREYLRSNPSGVVGIVPVHLYGRACEMDGILNIAKEFKLFIVEDVAQAFGGSWKDKKLGTLGDLGAFSFFPSKNLGGFGDGGMVATNDPALAETTRMLTKHGGKDKNNVDHLGYNARLDTLQAAVLLAKLKQIDRFNAKRFKLAQKYTEQLSSLRGIVLPKINSGHACHQFTIRVLNGKRALLQEKLRANHIDTMIYYPVPLHKMKLFQNRCVARLLNNSELLAAEVLSLPIEPLYDLKTISYIAKKIREIVQ